MPERRINEQLNVVQGEADVTVEHITRMNIQQFRHFISNAKVAGGGFGAEKADESFAAMAPLCRVPKLSYVVLAELASL